MQVQEARMQHDDDAVKRTVNEYDDALEKYIPVLMQQAKIYWDRENFPQVEKIFRYAPSPAPVVPARPPFLLPSFSPALLPLVLHPLTCPSIHLRLENQSSFATTTKSGS